MAQERTIAAGEAREQPAAPQSRQTATREQAGQWGLTRREGSMPSTGSQSPFSLVRRFSEDMERFFGDVFSDFGIGRGGTTQRIDRDAGSTQTDWSPVIEVVDRDNEIVVCVDLPGVSADDVNVEVTEDMLTISGDRPDERQAAGGGSRPSERRYGRFSRSLELPQGVSPDDMRANFRNGVLEVAMPAPHREGRGRRIEVQNEPTEEGRRTH